jgi:hypothetical protein
MKKERNFKVKLHNIDLPTTVYLVAAENHFEVYERFSGIIINRGYYHTKATWRPYTIKIPTLQQLKKNPFILRPGKTVRTYYFYPMEKDDLFPWYSSMERKKYEAALEVIKLK